MCHPVPPGPSELVLRAQLSPSKRSVSPVCVSSASIHKIMRGFCFPSATTAPRSRAERSLPDTKADHRGLDRPCRSPRNPGCPQNPWWPQNPRSLPAHQEQLLLAGPRPQPPPDVHGEEGAAAVEYGGEGGHERGHHHRDHQTPQPCGRREHQPVAGDSRMDGPNHPLCASTDGVWGHPAPPCGTGTTPIPWLCCWGHWGRGCVGKNPWEQGHDLPLGISSTTSLG